MSKFIKIKNCRVNINRILAYEPRIIEAGFCEEEQKPYCARYELNLVYPFTESEPIIDHDGKFIFNNFKTCGERFIFETKEELESVVSMLDIDVINR